MAMLTHSCQESSDNTGESQTITQKQAAPKQIDSASAETDQSDQDFKLSLIVPDEVEGESEETSSLDDDLEVFVIIMDELGAFEEEEENDNLSLTGIKFGTKWAGKKWVKWKNKKIAKNSKNPEIPAKRSDSDIDSNRSTNEIEDTRFSKIPNNPRRIVLEARDFQPRFFNRGKGKDGKIDVVRLEQDPDVAGIILMKKSDGTAYHLFPEIYSAFKPGREGVALLAQPPKGIKPKTRDIIGPNTSKGAYESNTPLDFGNGTIVKIDVLVQFNINGELRTLVRYSSPTR